MGNGGIKTEVSFGKRGKEKRCLQQYFSLGISRISEGEKRHSSEDWDRGRRPPRVFKSQQFLVINFVP